MTIVTTSRRRTLLAWTPALTVSALVAASIVVVPMAAGAVSLPDKTPAEVLAMIAESDELAYSATVVKEANLGLPALDLGAGGMPQGAVDTAADATDDADDARGLDLMSAALEFVSGTHTARIAVDPQVGVRVQVQDRMSERNIIVNETEAWFYESRSNAATVWAVPDAEAVAAAMPEDAWPADEREKFAEALADGPSTPAEFAELILETLEADSTVTLADNVRVAGRGAYELVVTPDDSDTLVASVSLAIDAESGLPLRVVVTALDQDAPALSLGLTQLDLSTPDPSTFTFTPPPGATVEEVAPEVPELADGTEKPQRDGDVSDASPFVMVQGGWASIIEVSVPTDAEAAEGFDLGMVEQLATPVDGGFVVRTALATVFMTDDGRVLVGTVPLSVLQTAAAR